MVKKCIKNLIVLFLVACFISVLNIHSFAFGYNNHKQMNTKFGDLISERVVWDVESNKFCVERTYEKHSAQTRSHQDGATYTNTKTVKNGILGLSGSIELEYYVSGDFTWDTSAKKTWVSNVQGEVTYFKSGEIVDERTYELRNDTRRATAKYSFTNKIGKKGGTKRSISVSCNYRGSKS